MFKFRLNNFSKHHFELMIDNEFQRYIKVEELPSIISYLKNFNINYTIASSNEDKTVELKFDAKKEQEIKKTLLCGVNKTQVLLPNPVDKTVNNRENYIRKNVIFSYSDLSKYKYYWLSGERQFKSKLYAQLSRDLMEVPYIDEPEDFVEFKGKRAYHINHGTIHGIRQFEYAKNYLELVKQSGDKKWKNIANSLTTENLACFELAMFLYRAGRTNEDDWFNDNSYGQRSSELFRQIAKELGFNEKLVNAFADCLFNYRAPINFSYSLNERDNTASHGLVELLQMIARLSHNNDLVRCVQDLNAELKEDLAIDLRTLLYNVPAIPDTTESSYRYDKRISDDKNNKIDEIINSFLIYAADLCYETGSPVVSDTFKKFTINGSKLKAVECANNVESTISSLFHYQPNIIKQKQKLSIDEFCALTTAQLDIWSAKNVFDIVKIERKDQLEQIIQKLKTDHRTWRDEQTKELHALYNKNTNQIPSLKSLTRSMLAHRLPVNDVQFKIADKHPSLYAKKIEEHWDSAKPEKLKSENLDKISANRLAPTERWLQANGQNIEGIIIPPTWDMEGFNKVPVAECIKVEQEYLNTHIPLYHATRRMSYALDVFCSALANYSLLSSDSDLGNVAWIRHFYSRPNKIGRIESSIEKIKTDMNVGNNLDNMPRFAWHLLSCNPSLFQNSNHDAMESTADFYHDHQSVTELDFKDIFNEILDKTDLLLGNKDIREKIFKRIESACNNPELGTQGILYQYLIPFEMVNQVAYISGKNGRIDQENPDTLKTLLELQTSNLPKNGEELQVRLIVPLLMNSKFAKDIKVKNYTNINTPELTNLHELIHQCAYQAIITPNKEKPQTQVLPRKTTLKGGSFFGALDAITNAKTNKLEPPRIATNDVPYVDKTDLNTANDGDTSEYSRKESKK